MAMNIIAKDKKVIKWLGMPECYKQRLLDNQLKNAVEIEQNDVEASNQILLAQIKQEEVSVVHLIFNDLLLIFFSVTTKGADSFTEYFKRLCQ